MTGSSADQPGGVRQSRDRRDVPLRYFRRYWEESRGDAYDAWGPATHFFEVGDDGWPIRQVEVYDCGPILRYGPDHEEDQFGFLGQTSLDDGEDWSPHAITADEFRGAWQTLGLLLISGATIPTIDADLATAWLRAVHQMARGAQARVGGPVREPGPGRNHYRVDLRTACGEDRGMLLNAAIRLVAACRPAANEVTAGVFEVVPQEELFLAAGFRVARPAELATPLCSHHLAGLAEAERRDVRYHGPERIGDVFFNWFD